MKAIFVSFFSLSVLFSVSSCEWNRAFMGQPEDGTVKIERFDRVVNEFVHTGNYSSWQQLTIDYPQETSLLVERVLQLGTLENESIGDTLRTFFNDSALQVLRGDVDHRFADLTVFEKRLQGALRSLAEKCSDFETPRVYAQVSALNQSIVVGDSTVGISLDKYMGTDYPLYRKYFTECQRATMKPDLMVQDFLRFYLAAKYPPRRVPDRTLMERILYSGKINWVVAKVLDKSLIDEATLCEEARDWYRENEPKVWKALSGEELRNTSDSTLIFSVLSLAAEHPYFKDIYSRGVGTWIGMRIINAYMESHPDVTVDELLQTDDHAVLLEQSGYAPL